MSDTQACDIPLGGGEPGPGLTHPFGCKCEACCRSYWTPVTITSTSLLAPPDPQRLHPDDIEAIAQRVAAIVKPKRRAKR